MLTPKRSSVLELFKFVQVAPPFKVRYMFPPRPTRTPTDPLLVKSTALNWTGRSGLGPVEGGARSQVFPPSVVRMTEPTSPTMKPEELSENQTSYRLTAGGVVRVFAGT